MDTGFIILLVAAFGTSVLSAIVGMAGGLMLLAIMSVTLPAPKVVPLHGVVQLFANTARMVVFLRHIKWSIFLAYALPNSPGVAIAVWVWSGEALVLLKPFLGVFILLILVQHRTQPLLRDPPTWLYSGLGFVAGFLIHRITRLLLRAATPAVNRSLRRGQWFTAAALAFAHGTNDAQKGMGIITLILVLAGQLEQFIVPVWVMAVSATILTLGTTMGGWRIVRTVGFGLYRLRPLHGLNVQLASSAVVLGASLVGGPVSTTHVVSTSIMGVGASERPKAVRWQKAREIVLAWVMTMPGSGLLALLFWWLAELPTRLGG